MQKVDLKKVLEMLINEEQGNAENLLHQWFVEKTKTIHESLMQEDDDVLDRDDLTQGIKDDKDSIKSEEYFGEDDFDSEGEEDSHIDALAADDVEKDVDLDVDDDSEDEDSDGLEGEDKDIADIADEVEELQSELIRLKSLFAEIQNDEDSDKDSDAEAGPDKDLENGDASEESDEESDDAEGGDVEESFDFDFDDLSESFELETIKDPNLNGSKEIGKDGNAVKVNTTSPIPQEKTSNRVGGKAVEVKSVNHNGFERETAPKVGSLVKGQVRNAKQDLKPVAKGGDSAALLNKKGDGFGSDSPKSPIGAGAADLRGSRI